MAVVPGTSQGGMISIDDVLKNTPAENIVLQAGAKYLIDNNIRVFTHSVQTISKFSDQLHLEPSAEGLSLKALNSSKSAFASILFTRHFFSDYDLTKIDANANNLCRISMRSALAVFGRAGTHVDRIQLSCKLQVDPRADYLIAQMSHKHFITKCFVIPFRDCVVTYKHLFNDKSKLRNRVTLPARTLLTVLAQIGTDLDEVRIVATPDRFFIERFFTTEDDQTRIRRTEANIDLDVFERYSLQHSSEVAVNLKELKAVLSFADVTGMPVNLHFDQPGRPIIVAVEENADFVAEFVLATFDGPNTSFSHENEVVTEPVANVPATPQPGAATTAPNPVADSKQASIPPQPSPQRFQQRPTPQPFEAASQSFEQFDAIVDAFQPPEEVPRSSVGPVQTGGDTDGRNQLKEEAENNNNNDATVSQQYEPPENGPHPEINPFHELDDEILNDLPAPTPRSKLADDEHSSRGEMSAVFNTALPSEIPSPNERIDITAEPMPKSQLLGTAIPSTDDTSVSNSTKRVVIDEDCGFNLASWNSKQRQFLERDSASFDAKPSAINVDNTSDSPPISDIGASVHCEPANPPSPVYDFISLSCSPSVYLKGERPFNIRLAESQLNRLHQINSEMPSQQDDELSTSFVGRLLDAAVEKTKPNDSRRNSLASSNSSSVVEINPAPQTGNFAPAGISCAVSPPMAELFQAEAEDLAYDFPLNFVRLDELENAVESLRKRVGGFKRRPNTQQFSQERADLVEHLCVLNPEQEPGTNHGLKRLPDQQQLGDEEHCSPPKRHPQPSAAGTSAEVHSHQQQHKQPQIVECLEENAASERANLLVSDVNNVARRLTNSRTYAVIVERTTAPATTVTTTVKTSITMLSRPLAEIERDLHSDNSLEPSYRANVQSSTLAAAKQHNLNLSDDVIIVDDSPVGQNSSRARRPTARPQPAVNQRLLAAGPSGISEFQAPAVNSHPRWLNPTKGNAAATSSTSSVLLLEENCEGDDGWLSKPNTQRSQQKWAELPPKSSTVKAIRTKSVDSTDEELASILGSTTDCANERRNSRKGAGDASGRR